MLLVVVLDPDQVLLSSTCVLHLCVEDGVRDVQVQEQGELTIRIDENIDDTLANVDSAQAQLLKYMNSISSNRWLVMKVFAVLLFFLFVFIFFIA